jgi:hypothetical protein
MIRISAHPEAKKTEEQHHKTTQALHTSGAAPKNNTGLPQPFCANFFACSLTYGD